MKSAVETLSPTRAKLTVEVPFEELKPSLDAAYQKIAKQINVPGFRRGKVPPAVIDRQVGRGPVLDEAINAVVVMTDGRNEYNPDNNLERVVDELGAGSGETKLRVFSIAYGQGADLATLRKISQASNAAAYDATDPASISRVFTAVLSNF